MKLSTICDIILDEASSSEILRAALDNWVHLCSEVTQVYPNPSFDAWAEDSLLAQGVAINPEAAALCALDYIRSVAFIRGIYAAVNAFRLKTLGRPIEILYAGCGPYGTLVLPLLHKFTAGELKLYMLDVHQSSLDSVTCLLNHFELTAHAVKPIRADACHYQHLGVLDLVIAETMQKSLEQEPQFAVTANLAAQLSDDAVFIPQSIEVVLCLANLRKEKSFMKGPSNGQNPAYKREELATLCTLTAQTARAQMSLIKAHRGAEPLAVFKTTIVIPELADDADFDAVLCTRICVFQQYSLNDYDSQITLPQQCYELSSLQSGDQYHVSYTTGGYPKFNFDKLAASV